VHKREVRVIERILEKPQARALPDLVELVDPPELRVLGFRNVGQREQRVLECDPGIAVVRLAAVGGHPRVRRYGLGLGLRNTDAVAGPVVGSPMIAADKDALGRAAFGEAGGAMTAAVREGRQPALGIEKQHYGSVQEGERPEAVLQMTQGHRAVPKAPQHRLLHDEHGSSFQRAGAVDHRHKSHNGR
jgi:hypothetical protein